MPLQPCYEIPSTDLWSATRRPVLTDGLLVSVTSLPPGAIPLPSSSWSEKSRATGGRRGRERGSDWRARGAGHACAAQCPSRLCVEPHVFSSPDLSCSAGHHKRLFNIASFRPGESGAEGGCVGAGGGSGKGECIPYIGNTCC
eukprot:2052499-Rhodomonas_salina.2